ncbi:MAG: alkaline phosphatase family protein [Actinomycetota bacterium]
MEPVRPDYTGACVAGLVRALRGREAWIPDPVPEAEAVVLFVVDGLGWQILEQHRRAMPALEALAGGPISTVVPSTTTTALTSLTTGLSPAEHGIVGYRLLVGGEVMNVLRWSMSSDRRPPAPEDLQPRLAFNGEPLPVVTRADFASTGFTNVHLRGARFCGWHAASSIAVHCRRLLGEGERFVYAYYGNADIVFHMHGLADDFLLAELASVDRLVADLLDAIPSSAALVVTADHGHVPFDRWIETTPLEGFLTAQSGEARFRYLHARRGAEGDLLAAAADLYASDAWVFPRDRLVDEGWLGPQAMTSEVRRRVGDVVLAAREPVGFLDPANSGERRLRSGHGSLTPGEMLVPLLAARGRA